METAIKIMSYISACSFFFVLICYFVEGILDGCSVKQSVFSCVLLVIGRKVVPICIDNFFTQDVNSTVISMLLMVIAYFIGFFFFLFAFVFFVDAFDDVGGELGFMFLFEVDLETLILNILSSAESCCTFFPLGGCLYKFCAEIALIKAAIG